MKNLSRTPKKENEKYVLQVIQCWWLKKFPAPELRVSHFWGILSLASVWRVLTLDVTLFSKRWDPSLHFYFLFLQLSWQIWASDLYKSWLTLIVWPSIEALFVSVIKIKVKVLFHDTLLPLPCMKKCINSIIWIIYSFVVMETDDQLQMEECELECLQCFGWWFRRRKAFSSRTCLCFLSCTFLSCFIVKYFFPFFLFLDCKEVQTH